ncbi:MAG: hypothetical protein J6Q61_06450 [Bacteroidales bacterium]|nr:hypothetical protein [Bacteroidales bacterium]
MNYLTYDEYQEIGGVLDFAAFSRNIDRACAMIDIRTQSRLEKFAEIPQIVKAVCRDLVEYITTNTVEKTVTSRSQSAGGLSESESYAEKTADDYSADLDRIFEPLAVVKTKNGISITYRGAMS